MAVDALQALSGTGSLREPFLDGNILRGRVDSGAAVLPLVLGQLAAAGLEVASATVSRPSLDDVYLRHTGRSYRAVANSPEVPAVRKGTVA